MLAVHKRSHTAAVAAAGRSPPLLVWSGSSPCLLRQAGHTSCSSADHNPAEKSNALVNTHTTSCVYHSFVPFKQNFDDVLSLAIKTQIKTYLCRLSVSLRRLGCIGAVPEENVDTDHVNYCCYYDFQFHGRPGS